jgi:hypothetical protein
VTHQDAHVFGGIEREVHLPDIHRRTAGAENGVGYRVSLEFLERFQHEADLFPAHRAS